jgi:hypothetical protein
MMINYSFYEIIKIKYLKVNMSFYHDIDQQILNLKLLIKDIMLYLDFKII